MNRRLWLISTSFTILLTALVVIQTGLPSTSRLGHRLPRHIELHGRAHAADPWSTGAAARYRQNAPTHWRDCLLQQ